MDFFQNALAILREFWPHITGLALVLLPLLASAHVILNKRDTRATIGWVGLIWLAPVLGVVLYILLGVNRIKRRGTLLREGQPRTEPQVSVHVCSPATLAKTLGPHRHIGTLVELVGRLTQRPLLEGNLVEPLIGGDAAYPSMLRAIDAATQTVALSSYIFDNDRVGQMFVEALARAVGRGVEVRVLIDDIGAAIYVSSHQSSFGQGGGSRRAVLANLRAGLLCILQFAQPPENPDRRWPGGIHRRFEYPRSLFSPTQAAPSRA